MPHGLGTRAPKKTPRPTTEENRLPRQTLGLTVGDKSDAVIIQHWASWVIRSTEESHWRRQWHIFIATAASFSVNLHTALHLAIIPPPSRVHSITSTHLSFDFGLLFRMFPVVVHIDSYNFKLLFFESEMFDTCSSTYTLVRDTQMENIQISYSISLFLPTRCLFTHKTN